MKRSSVVCWLSSLCVAAFFMVGPACAADVHVTRRAGVIGGAGAGVGVFYCASDVHYIPGGYYAPGPCYYGALAPAPRILPRSRPNARYPRG